MSTNRYEYFEEVWNDDIQHTQKGFIISEIINQLKSVSFVLYKIPLSFRYRPDLISKQFYGTGKYHWVLTYVNDINNAPEGFGTNVVIKIPSSSIIGTLV